MVENRLALYPEGLTGGAAALPDWDLRDLYASPDDPRIVADCRSTEEAAKAFASRYQGKLAELPGSDLAGGVEEYEKLQEAMGRLMSYAQLLFSADSENPASGKFYQTISERVTAISTDTLFFTLELNRIGEAVLAKKLQDPALARYAPWLRDLRVFLPHQLSDELERLLLEKDVTGHSAWSRLFDETTAGMRLTLNGEELTLSATLNKLSDADRAVREAAGKAVGEALTEREECGGGAGGGVEEGDGWAFAETAVADGAVADLDGAGGGVVHGRVRSSVLRTLPAAFRGSWSMKATWRGTL